MLDLQAGNFRDPGSRGQAELANQQVRVSHPPQHMHSLLFRENAPFVHLPLPGEFHARDRVRERIQQQVKLAPSA